MGDPGIKCPLCCDLTFNSKHELVEHLSILYREITCPVCKNKWSSVANLIDHLNLDDCRPENTGAGTGALHPLTFDLENHHNNGLDNANNHMNDLPVPKLELLDAENGTNQQQLPDPFAPKDIPDDPEFGKMYVELLGKQRTKPCLQTQELKLVKEHGVSRYIIMADEDCDLTERVVTKQNTDGTISMTTVKDMKLESETVITQDNEIEDSHEEIYSCNTCGVSFTSVLEHIQNYHNDQDVVVEEPLDDTDGNNDMLPMPSFEVPLEEYPCDKQNSRRMITETGSIVEDPLLFKTTSVTEEKVAEKTARAPTKRYQQIEKFCDSVVKDIKQPDEKNGPFHKVVIKEMDIDDGVAVNKLKVFNCLSCNIYVSTLEEFKTRPCKVLRYPCSLCDVGYDNAKSLCAHMKVHKTKPSTVSTNACISAVEPPAKVQVFECGVCSTIFMTHKSLKLHKRMHDPIKNRPIDCPVENSDGSETSNDKYLCSICDKLIPIDFRNLHQNMHKTTEKFHCDICNKKFQSNDYLEMHMNVHTIDKAPLGKQNKSNPYRCLYCDRRFARPHEKVKHERIHTGEKPHSCEICGKSFRVSYCLTLHMRTHTGARPYACPHCGKRFKAHSVYNHHLLTHSDVRAYKCPYCPKAFKTSVQLAGHKNSHTKPFSCQQCNRPFASLYAVRVHTETHARQNNLKFSCSLCGASYARAFALKDHIKQVHNKDADKVDNLTILPDDEWMIQQNADQKEDVVIGKELSQVSDIS